MMPHSAIKPPIIVIGMHRSGTSMISRMLEELGLFMGKRKDENREAPFFRNLNAWLLRQSGGAWHNPESIQYLLDNAEACALATDYIRYMMKTPRAISYLGWNYYLRYRSPAYLSIPWGWKDPRSTYTLPLWLDLFPEAKVIHVYRHGVDVANSLRVRDRQVLVRSSLLHSKRKRLCLYWLYPKRKGFNTARIASLEGGFSLWEAYLQKGQTHTRQLGSRAMGIRYEDFLSEPYQGLTSVARFCGLPVSDAAIANASARVRKDRAYAYQKDPELRAFAENVTERLSRGNY